MANKSFSFNKFERSYFNVELKDGSEVFVKMPQKKTFERLVQVKAIDADTPFDKQLTALAGLCADIMSNNKTDKKVAADFLAKNYDFEELYAFMEAYVDFVRGAQDNPN